MTIPILTVDWGFVGSWGHGSDYGWAGWFPRVCVGVASFPIDFVLPGFLQVEGAGPPDEPMLGGYSGLGWGDRNVRIIEVLERQAQKEDILGFWRVARVHGDPFAQLALDMHENLRGSTWKTRVAIRRLEQAYVYRENRGYSANTRLNDEESRRLKGDVGIKLIKAHLEYLRADIRGNEGTIRGVLSARQINRYHYRVFDQEGLPRKGYGGWWVPKPLQRTLYCPECDPLPN